jgi:phytoene synthase
MLAQFQVSQDRIHALSNGAAMEARERSLLGELGNRAEHYYQSADRLLPLIDADSRAALWVLVTIYHGLLKKIERSGYEVFEQRISVPTSRKLSILAQGAAMSLGNKVLA